MLLSILHGIWWQNRFIRTGGGPSLSMRVESFVKNFLWRFLIRNWLRLAWLSFLFMCDRKPLVPLCIRKKSNDTPTPLFLINSLNVHKILILAHGCQVHKENLKQEEKSNGQPKRPKWMGKILTRTKRRNPSEWAKSSRGRRLNANEGSNQEGTNPTHRLHMSQNGNRPWGAAVLNLVLKSVIYEKV